MKPGGKDRKRIALMNKNNMRQRADYTRELDEIKERTLRKGYISLDDLNTIMEAPIYCRYREDRARHIPNYKGFGWSRVSPIAQQNYDMFDSDYVREILEKDRLPFKAMFYLALESEDFDKAEIIRRNWITKLEEIKETYVERNLRIPQAAGYQIEKLSSVAGLTDPMLVKLRNELAASMSEKNWDDAQKIQNIITSRVKELRDLEKPKIIVKDSTEGGKTVIHNYVPATQKHVVKHVPSYGAQDVARALSVMSGKPLNHKTAGAAMLFDILFKK
jgi:hypothetical protein